MIQRIPLRQEISAILRNRILDGSLPAGSPIREEPLSAELGVSRTPVREALYGLENEGLVEAKLGCGFSVTSVDPEAVADLYPIVGTLEALAVRIGFDSARADVDRLRQLNKDMSTSTVPRRLSELDRAWHESLWINGPNRELINLLSTLYDQVRRVDGSLTRGLADVPGSCGQHEAVIVALEQGNSRTAATAIERHWKQGLKVVQGWIADLPSGEKGTR